MMPRRLGNLLALAAVLMATLVVAGCGGDTEAPAVCGDVDALKTSLADLKDVQIDQSSLTSLQEKFTQVKTDVATLVADAKDEYAVQVDAVTKATDDLRASLEAAVASPSAVTVAAVAASLPVLGSSLTALADAVKSTC